MENTFNLRITCENAAFFDEENRFNPWEVARILNHVAKLVQEGVDTRSIHDLNGNKVGEWSLTVEDQS